MRAPIAPPAQQSCAESLSTPGRRASCTAVFFLWARPKTGCEVRAPGWDVPNPGASVLQAHVQNRDTDIAKAKVLIQRACENYKRDHAGQSWDVLVRSAEKRWLDKRDEEIRWALVRSLLGH